ncbi:hypothetical protein CDAR_320251 [Caerostris darwini]|uniref:Uncharacterized protein n=1 Tax=Caerostris darwini TaxID=1538125 RepID=A0AAV4PFH7_9ARAC|nr:hypothetical protein CDAR_320251 [Caerostris darwini]
MQSNPSSAKAEISNSPNPDSGRIMPFNQKDNQFSTHFIIAGVLISKDACYLSCLGDGSPNAYTVGYGCLHGRQKGEKGWIGHWLHSWLWMPTWQEGESNVAEVNCEVSGYALIIHFLTRLRKDGVCSYRLLVVLLVFPD